MRILLISHIFPPAIDGGSKVVHKIGEYFESKNNEVLYISSNCHSTDDFVTPQSVPIHSNLKNHLYLPVYKNLRKILKLLYVITGKDIFLVLKKGPVFKLIPTIKTIKQIKRFSPEIIIAGPLPTSIAIYANLVKKYFAPRSKLIINASFHETDHDFFNKPLIKAIRSADLVWALTQHEVKTFVDKLKINPKNIVLLGNGVDENIINKNIAKYDSQNILFIGSLSAHKNIEFLISAFESVHQKFPKSTLTIAGQKTLYYPKIKKYISESVAKKSIKIILSPQNNQILDLIDNCQLLVQPSLQESFGLTIIEANARKKPAVVSNIPSMSELITNMQSGLTFDIDSINDFQSKIETLLINPKKCKELGLNGQKYVINNYTWNKIGNKLESVILNL